MPLGVAVFEAAALVAGFDDVAMIGEAVAQRRGHVRIAECGGPSGEAQVGVITDVARGARGTSARFRRMGGSQGGAGWRACPSLTL